MRERAPLRSLAVEPVRRSVSDHHPHEALMRGGNRATAALVTRSRTLRAQRSAVQPTVQRSPAAELVDEHTSWGALDEAALGQALKGRMTDAGFILDVIGELGSTDRDDVAFEFAKASSDDEVKGWAGSEAGRRVLVVLVGELGSGSTSDEEAAQRDRLTRLLAADQDTPGEGGGGPAPPDGSLDAEADQIIADHTNMGGANLQEEELGATLRGMLPQQAALVRHVMTRLDSSDRDDVAGELLDVEEAELTRIAQDPGGRQALLDLVRYVSGGWYDTDSEEGLAQKTMRAITAADRGAGGEKPPVEIITFTTGTLDIAGTLFARGAKGHTALTIGDQAYSFELGWQCGLTRSAYLASKRAEGHDGIGQVIQLNDEDHETLQNALNGACATGTYALGGDICTDATARALSEVLAGLQSGWDPQGFIRQVEETGAVTARRSYPSSRHDSGGAGEAESE